MKTTTLTRLDRARIVSIATLSSLTALLLLNAGCRSLWFGGTPRKRVTVQVARWFDDKRAAVSLRVNGARPPEMGEVISRLNYQGRDATQLVRADNGGYDELHEAWRATLKKSLAEGAASSPTVVAEVPSSSEPCRTFVIAPDQKGDSAPEGATFEEKLAWTIKTNGWATFNFMLPAGAKTMEQVSDTHVREIDHLADRGWDLWFASPEQVRTYEAEREAARVGFRVRGTSRVKIKLRCGTDPAQYDHPLTIRVDLTREWNANRIQVVTEDGTPIAVRRRSGHWGRLFIPVPPVSATYFVEAVSPEPEQTKETRSVRRSRRATHESSGVTAEVCKWPDEKKMALSLRFDDSLESHILKAVPILREYGFTGTFLINPGRKEYLDHKAAWEACAAKGDQEFGNHTFHHTGARNDQETDRELGDCSRYIWALFPDKSKLLAFDKGGATTWTMIKPFQYYIDKYHLLETGGSLSMADEYGHRVSRFERALEGYLKNGRWMRSHFHPIGDGHLGISEENFRATLDVVKKHGDSVWVAGMAAIHEYETERNAAGLSFDQVENGAILLKVSCGTDPELYNQPLTVRLTLPEGTDPASTRISNTDGAGLDSRVASKEEVATVLFKIPPVDASYRIEVPRATPADD